MAARPSRAKEGAKGVGLYIFYIDETGNLDTRGMHSGMDYSASAKDWLYVLTGLGVFEHKKDYSYFNNIYPLLYNSGNAVEGKVDGLQIFPNNSPLLDWWEKKSPLAGA